MKIACFSVATVDFFPQQNKYYAGGNSLNQVIRYSQMGHRSAFIGAIGTDEAGDRIENLLQAESVDISHMKRLKGNTARNQIINDDFGERYGIEGAWDGGVYEEYQLGERDWDYISNHEIWATHANSPCYAEALKRKKDSQMMSVDFLHLKDYELLKKSLEVIDIAFFGGTIDMVDELLMVSREYERIIVLTLGSEGSIAFEGGKMYMQAALAIDKVIDTTGCGDAFQAAFTASYYETNDIEASLSTGADMGRKAARSYGGIPWNNLR